MYDTSNNGYWPQMEQQVYYDNEHLIDPNSALHTELQDGLQQYQNQPPPPPPQQQQQQLQCDHFQDMAYNDAEPVYDVNYQNDMQHSAIDYNNADMAPNDPTATNYGFTNEQSYEMQSNAGTPYFPHLVSTESVAPETAMPLHHLYFPLLPESARAAAVLQKAKIDLNALAYELGAADFSDPVSSRRDQRYATPMRHISHFFIDERLRSDIRRRCAAAYIDPRRAVPLPNITDQPQKNPFVRPASTASSHQGGAIAPQIHSHTMSPPQPRPPIGSEGARACASKSNIQKQHQQVTRSSASNKGELNALDATAAAANAAGYHAGATVAACTGASFGDKSPSLGYTAVDGLKSQETWLPDVVHCYHSVVPLGYPWKPSVSEAMGQLRTAWYRAICERDGVTYALLRICDYKLPDESLLSSILEKWSHLDHPNIVRFHDAFTTSAFGASQEISHGASAPGAASSGASMQALVLVYDFYSGAVTLASVLNQTGPLRPDIPQHVVLARSILVQMQSAVRALNSVKLHVGKFDSSKILVTSPGRVRLNAIAAQCFIEAIRDQSAAQQSQQETKEDNMKLMLSWFAKKVLASSKTVPNGCNWPRDIALAAAAGYAKFPAHAELGDPLILDLKPDETQHQQQPEPQQKDESKAAAVGLSQSADVKPDAGGCVGDCSAKIAGLFSETDRMRRSGDYVEDQLARSLENGRLARLMMKLNLLLDRPEYATDPRWGETGDRYFVRLFRGYVFHAVDEAGNPILDVGHIVTCLNKLDAGVAENILLTSGDGRTCLVVSYAEIKRCIEDAFQTFLKSSSTAGAQGARSEAPSETASSYVKNSPPQRSTVCEPIAKQSVVLRRPDVPSPPQEPSTLPTLPPKSLPVFPPPPTVSLLPTSSEAAAAAVVSEQQHFSHCQHDQPQQQAEQQLQQNSMQKKHSEPVMVTSRSPNRSTPPL